MLEEDVVDVQPGSELISGFRKSLLGMRRTAYRKTNGIMDR